MNVELVGGLIGLVVFLILLIICVASWVATAISERRWSREADRLIKRYWDTRKRLKIKTLEYHGGTGFYLGETSEGKEVWSGSLEPDSPLYTYHKTGEKVALSDEERQRVMAAVSDEVATWKKEYRDFYEQVIKTSK